MGGMRNALLGLGLSLSAFVLSACSGVTPPPPGSGDTTSSTTSPATSETTTSAPAEPSTTSAPATTTPPGDVKPPVGDKACDKPARKYVAKDTQKCAVIRYFCEAGYVAFHDDCGCGCEPTH